MYETLVTALRKVDEYDSGYAKLMYDAADTIEEITRENESLAKSVNEASEILRRRWIPVTERLPETPGEYMVAYHPCYWDRVHDEIKVGLDSFRGKTSWAKKKYQSVTHWMPLPEPPKEET